MKKIIIFKAAIDSLKTFADLMSEGFLKQGYDVLMTDMQMPEKTCEEVFAFAERGNTAAIFFNHVGMTLLTPEGMSVWNELDIDCYNYIVDHPMYYHEAIIFPIKKLTFVCVDAYHKKYIDNFYNGKVRSIFLPLAGIKDNNPEIPFEKREIDVLFTGAYLIDDNIHIHTAGLGEGLKQIWIECYEKLLTNTHLTLEHAIITCFKNRGIVLEGEDLRDTIRLFRDMDGMLRSRMRERVIKALANGGVKVHVYGEGWECLDCKKENLVIHGRIPFDETIPLMQHAKIVLNVMPWFKAGIHDRVYSAMLNKAVGMTDGSEYIDSTLLDEENVLLYSLEQLEDLPEKIKWYLQNPEELKRIARNGYEYAKEIQTWQYRAKQLSKFIEEEFYAEEKIGDME